MAVKTKLNFGSYDTYLEEQKKKAADTDTGTALSYFRDAAAGKPSAAVSTAISANREAIARQANNMRSAAAQAVAGAGGLGQGQAVRGTQETEGKILQALADSRNKEQQALAADQSSANSTLLSQANNDTSTTLEKLKLGLSSESPSVKAAAQRAVSEYLNANGVQMATGESAEAYDKAVADEAENSPEALLAKLTAEQNLKKGQAAAALSGTGTPSERITAAYAYNTDDAYTSYIAAIGSSAGPNDQIFWNQYIVPAMEEGNTEWAKKLINSRIAPQSTAPKGAGKVAKVVTNPVGSLF